MTDAPPEPFRIADDETLAQALMRYTRDHPNTVFRLERATGAMNVLIDSVHGGGGNFFEDIPPKIVVRDIRAPSHHGQVLRLHDLHDIYPVARVAPGSGAPVMGPSFPRTAPRQLPQGKLSPRNFTLDLTQGDAPAQLRAHLAREPRLPAFRLERTSGPATVHLVEIGEDGLRLRDLDAWDDGDFHVRFEEILAFHAEGIVSASSGTEIIPCQSGRVAVWRPEAGAPGCYVVSTPPGDYLREDRPSRAAARAAARLGG